MKELLIFLCIGAVAFILFSVMMIVALAWCHHNRMIIKYDKNRRKKEMNDNIKELLELINENPELPIICMVESEIVGEDYGRRMAQIGWSVIGEFAAYNERFYDDREEFTEAYYDSNDEILDERFGYNPRMSYPDAPMCYKREDIKANKAAEAQLDKYLEEVADRAFKRAILVYIDTPDEFEEFEDEEVSK